MGAKESDTPWEVGLKLLIILEMILGGASADVYEDMSADIFEQCFVIYYHFLRMFKSILKCSRNF